MKKFFKSFLIAVCLILAINVVTVNESKANVVSSKQDLVDVIRVQENGVTYIVVYVDNVMIMKVEEL